MRAPPPNIPTTQHRCRIVLQAPWHYKYKWVSIPTLCFPPCQQEATSLHLRHHTNDNAGPLNVILVLLLQIAKVSRTDVLDLHWQKAVTIAKPLFKHSAGSTGCFILPRPCVGTLDRVDEHVVTEWLTELKKENPRVQGRIKAGDKTG